ncbi:MAG: NAD(P)H-dependent glycerol-3-phosphate dehydrogenase [Bacillaceae bacterium]|uniref:NAD(P)H-dependent glycerol-3-phosphate dehydrogenase n=1 Tax=Aeribacillus TaxID=1055323 RepID=UPI0007B498E4|nr:MULTISPECIES: NAD(P)H-dependent glycerol-3-phosphate dehydrogenase [Aeribacillus]REJ17387.1 MAG: NAD(P)H-dependent glycerol-3-phosphate dehydrogenase [Bacillaceae bacterium]KZM52711.1 glycerol-3-phosphate dehydrogenase [Aeribacillus pallidus]MED0648934.1 NAD(P)H-dependent glycerol-3-phosphate dehydrogenase [Aeribacillus composti]MED0715871.1 NAD(P)H-dependent glycerol-3-phosphate dehydrogenase [Aeribacillus composti]MED0746775.1 NAD(P)H-dependent glycerol-3-phosphate dehydrogenase [Aeribaci
MAKVAILGAGSWGTALAIVLCDNGHEVHLWGHRKEHIEAINRTKKNEKYLPNVPLPDNLTGFYFLKDAVENVETIVLAVPTKAIREVLSQLREAIDRPVLIVHVSKGIEPGSLKRISEIIEEEMPPHLLKDVVVLSGPSHAEEVSLRQPTTVTSASKNIQAAKFVQDLFINRYFRVYTNPDIIGVEIGGALKNIIALAAGISDGLGYGDNAKAALITRGLAEISRLGCKMGANPLTFSGLAGIGDLIVTCTSVHSRNWRAGHLLGKGKKLDEVLESMGMVVEGVRTTKAAKQLSEKYSVKMPITNVLYEVLFHEKDPKEAVEELMARVKTHEMEDLVNILENRNEEL